MKIKSKTLKRILAAMVMAVMIGLIPDIWSISILAAGNNDVNIPIYVEYTAPEPVDAPIFTPLPGSYVGSKNITIISGTDGAVIHYTTDGSTPDETSPVYTGPIFLDSSKTIKAVAIKDNVSSEVITAGYTINNAGVLTVTLRQSDEVTNNNVVFKLDTPQNKYSTSFLTEEERQEQTSNGTDYDILVNIEHDEYDNVQPIVENIVDDANTKKKVVYDITLVQNGIVKNNLPSNIKLEFTAPQDLDPEKADDISLIRIHESSEGMYEVALLDISYNNESKTISFETNAFSDYVLLYSAKTETLGEAVLTLFDDKTLKTLKDGKFTLYNATANSKIASYKTDKNGQIAVGSLSAGNYYFAQDEAPSGYKKTSDKITFTIDSGEKKYINVFNTNNSNKSSDNDSNSSSSSSSGSSQSAAPTSNTVTQQAQPVQTVYNVVNGGARGAGTGDDTNIMARIIAIIIAAALIIAIFIISRKSKEK